MGATAATAWLHALGDVGHRLIGGLAALIGMVETDWAM
jgi:hypothetical protein